jgi:Na+/proline symporter
VANDARQALIAWVQIVVNVIAGIVFLVWINRAYKNLYALRAEGLRFSSGWAVAWFFIPFASLFRPYQVMSEVLRASDPAADLSDSDSWKYLSLPRIVGIWWTFFLVSNWASQLAGRFILRADTASDLLTATYAYMGSEAVSIIGIVITVILVQRVRRVQTEKYGKILQQHLAEPVIG